MQHFAAMAVCENKWPCAATALFRRKGKERPNFVYESLNHLAGPRCAQSLYADLSGNVLLHASVPALGLRAEQWAIVSWGHTHAQLPDFADSRFTYRCACRAVPKTLPSRSPSSSSGWQQQHCRIMQPFCAPVSQQEITP